MPVVSMMAARGFGRVPRPLSIVQGLQKTVGGVTYTLIMAHKAYNYPSTPFPGASDTFFRNMFTTGQNTSFTSLSQVFTMTDGSNYVNDSLFTQSCTGYLLEAYNSNGTQFPVWGSFDTTAHTWQSLRTAGAVYQNPYLTVSNSKLYSSTDTSTSRTVGHTAFLTTSKNGASTSVSDPFTDDAGDYIFMGITTTAFTAADSYDTTFNSPTTGVTSIGIAMSDGSGTGNQMSLYHRRTSSYKHCTAVSNGTPITTGRSTSHGGADSTGFFLIWGKF